MGKRKKSSRGPAKKTKDKLPSVFDCLFCNHEKSVTVNINKKLGVGHLSCKVCGQNFSCSVNYLSDPVDVFADWVDAADLAAKTGERPEEGRSGGATRLESRKNREDAYDSDGGAADYEGEGVVADDIED